MKGGQNGGNVILLRSTNKETCSSILNKLKAREGGLTDTKVKGIAVVEA